MFWSFTSYFPNPRQIGREFFGHNAHLVSYLFIFDTENPPHSNGAYRPSVRHDDRGETEKKRKTQCGYHGMG